jgi:DNA-binding MarR family transcriptional regulator
MIGAKRRGNPANAEFELRHSPFFLLARLSNRYVQDLDAVLKAIDMDVPGWRTLMIVAEHEPRSVSEIAELSAIRLSTMTRVVQRLVEQGLVRVQQRAEDGRKTDVYLTPAGHAACTRVRVIASGVYERATADFSDGDISRLCELLQRAHRNLAPTAAAPAPRVSPPSRRRAEPPAVDARQRSASRRDRPGRRGPTARR